jgi:hypothetical protein
MNFNNICTARQPSHFLDSQPVKFFYGNVLSQFVNGILNDFLHCPLWIFNIRLGKQCPLFTEFLQFSFNNLLHDFRWFVFFCELFFSKAALSFQLFSRNVLRSNNNGVHSRNVHGNITGQLLEFLITSHKIRLTQQAHYNCQFVITMHIHTHHTFMCSPVCFFSGSGFSFFPQPRNRFIDIPICLF